ncbi:non-ribosomal peptide synthetase [Kocuria sp. SL71]|uniref:non-ribosomal peptide synthetase n=1 Tax=Kocuria sp. SL71 TaxID=2995151 RepID=UPI002274D98A|nr:amino acid adenylation domain-containing protein [Kocuria sp. SL71]MCY1684002.1 amino acid adenylation domain-containing protein [Kocuria sp. SL71]
MVLGGLTASDNVCFGEPVSGRGGSFDGVEDLLGMFINTVPVRVGLAPDRSFADVVKGVTRDRVATLDDQHVPLHELNHSLGVETLFDSLFVFENAPMMNVISQGPSEFSIGRYELRDFDSYPLSVKVVPGDSLNVSIDYRTDCFGDSYIRSAFRAWESILRQVVADPDVAVGRVSVSSAESVASVLELGAGEAPEEAPCLVHELFERAARSGPESPAVVWDSGSMSYEELDRASNRLARRLMRAGVDVGSTVGLMLSRGPGMVVSVLASLKAGARYLPIDPELPAERIDFMLNDSTPGVLLTNPECSADVGASSGTVRLVLDEVMSAEEYAGVDDSPIVSEELSRALEVEDAAYTIYTSGSTGRPKGVVVTHRGMAALFSHESASLEIDQRSRVAQFAALSFDISVEELFLALLSGATLLVPPPGKAGIDFVIDDFIVQHHITAVSTTPGLLQSMRQEDWESVDTIIVGGEACSPELVAKWAPGRQLVNTYGPTEATVCVSMTGSLAGWEGVVPIGRPLPGSRLYVLDSAMRPCPLGTTGELFIAGEGLARGYLGRADLTAQKFVADPFAADGSRMYRSGDLAHWGADGQIYFDGRADDQVKIRGYRIEIGEIESTLRRCHGVGQAAVVVREDQPAVRQLVGYVVPDTGGTSLDVSAIRDQLAGWLPDYMVPSVVMEVGVLPLTTNGKLDAEALPKPGDVPRADMVAAENDAEQQIMDLFAEVLGIGEVSATDSFFALGGDSITAIQLVNRARSKGVALKANEVFAHPKPRDLARSRRDTVEEAQYSQSQRGSTRPLLAHLDTLPSMRWAAKYGPLDSPTFNGFHQALTLKIQKASVDQVVRAIERIAERHESLRIIADGGRQGSVIRIRSMEEFSTKSYVSAVKKVHDPIERDRYLQERGNVAVENLSATNGDTVHAVLEVDVDESVERIILIVHHFATDAVSWSTLVQDLDIFLDQTDKVPDNVPVTIKQWVTHLTCG